MKNSFIQTTITTFLLSTLFAFATEATISPSNDPINICDTTPYVELNAVGDSNNNHIYTWTVNDDIHAYGPVFYYVPATTGDSNNIIRLYKGVIANQTVDKDPDKLLDEVTVNVNDCDS
jgi:hypothetical protein